MTNNFRMQRNAHPLAAGAQKLPKATRANKPLDDVLHFQLSKAFWALFLLRAQSNVSSSPRTYSVLATKRWLGKRGVCTVPNQKRLF
eukprot:4708364-Amphidinium_carterae.1